LRRRLQPEALSTSDLQRWLRAEKYDVGKAEGRLRTHIKWRADYLPHGRVLEVRRRAGLQPASLPQTWPDWESAGAARLRRRRSVLSWTRKRPSCRATTAWGGR